MTGAATAVATTTHQRAYSAHQPKWQRFQTNLIIPSTQAAAASAASKQQQPQQPPFLYQRQYSHVYHQRLALLGPRCWQRIDQELAKQKQQQQQDEEVTKVERVLELREGVPSLAVGTLVMESSSNDNKKNKLHPDSVCHPSDALYLEDESGRVTLEFLAPADNDDGSAELSLHQFCTGVVVGVQGTVGANGVMQVKAVYPPTPPPPPPSPVTSLSEAQTNHSPETTTTTTGAPHLLLLSGLDCGGTETSSLPRDMLLSFLQGRLGALEKAACVSQVLIAGGLIARPPSNDNNDNDNAAAAYSAASALRDLDGFLLQLAATGIPVAVMPGQHDPTTANWPQRPIHKALLPRSSLHYGSNMSKTNPPLVARTPNPYAALHHGKQLVVGTDGQNVRDLTKRLLIQQQQQQPQTPNKDHKEEYNKDNSVESNNNQNVLYTPVSELQALERTLEWSHLCPTGPDSVPTAPHAEQDPMVLQVWPRLYVAGNATQFATKLKKVEQGEDDAASSLPSLQCRLICIPRFGATGQAVLVNLETLQVEILRFED